MVIRKVYRVLSSNLLELESGDRVRLISVGNEKVYESEEDTSTAFLEGMVSGKYVKIEMGSKMTDKSGHLLAYVYIKTSKTGDPVWSMVNKRMIVTGYSPYLEDPLNKEFSLELDSLSEVAKLEKRKIWTE
jgi:endonuclease YncB( thermonuclease family)